jgi:hypothetical protein
MKMNITLATRRPWNWKVFLALVVLVIPAGFVQMLVTGMSLSGAKFLVMGQGLITRMLLPAAIGLLLANRIGLGIPFVESWARQESVSRRFRYVAAVTMIAGILVALMYQILEYGVFRAPMNSQFEEAGIPPVEDFFYSPGMGFLASFEASILEEVFFRLFGLTLLAWVGSLLFHEIDGRPRLAVLWTANLVVNLVFAAGHLATASAWGWPLTPLVITRGMLFNMISGMTFGWLYFSLGLESAMLGHFLTDFVFYTMLRLPSLPVSNMGWVLATAGVGLVILLALAWGWRTFQRESRFVTGGELIE